MDTGHQAGNPSVAEVKPCTIPLVAAVGYVELGSVYKMVADSLEVVGHKSCSVGSKPPTSAIVWPFHVEAVLGAAGVLLGLLMGADVGDFPDGVPEPPVFAEPVGSSVFVGCLTQGHRLQVNALMRRSTMRSGKAGAGLQPMPT